MNAQGLFVRALRRRVPSISRLTYHWPIKLLLNAVDLPARLWFPEFRKIPPNHMRVRVGVGWRLFNNHPHFSRASESFWFYVLSQGLFRFSDTVIDLGVGCGRYAHHVRDYSHNESRFMGTYIGVDVDSEMLDWCRANFPAERFRFHHSPHRATSYNRTADFDGYYKIPEPDGSVDFIFSTSLFTHLLEKELKNYLQEAHRLLKPGRSMAATCFCLDYPPPTYGTRHTFRHRVGNAHVESLAQPEAAVAYTEEFLVACATEAGFTDIRIRSSRSGWHPMLICRKPAVVDAPADAPVLEAIRA